MDGKADAQADGTPVLSFFRPPETLDLAREAGLGQARHMRTADLAQRYFSNRTDGLAPSEGESFLIATCTDHSGSRAAR